jgi:protein TonB
MTNVPDKRISDAIWNAVQSCKWIAGADAQGRPTAIWVILPIRFAGG